jgi:hypothetical protein
LAPRRAARVGREQPAPSRAGAAGWATGMTPVGEGALSVVSRILRRSCDDESCGAGVAGEGRREMPTTRFSGLQALGPKRALGGSGTRRPSALPPLRHRVGEPSRLGRRPFRRERPGLPQGDVNPRASVDRPPTTRALVRGRRLAGSALAEGGPRRCQGAGQECKAGLGVVRFCPELLEAFEVGVVVRDDLGEFDALD